MRHWHRCKRWTLRGLDCPFGGLAEHEEIEDPSDEEEAPEGLKIPVGEPVRPLVPPGRRAQDVAVQEPFVEGVIEDSRFPEVAEPVGALPLPPLPPPVRARPVPVRARSSRVPAQEPLRNPFRVPGLAQVLAARRANAAQRAVARGAVMVRGLEREPGPRGSERRTMARSERVVAVAASGERFKSEKGTKTPPPRGKRLSRGVVAGVAGGAAVTAGILRFTRVGGRGGFGGMFANMSGQFSALRAQRARSLSQNISGRQGRGGL